VTVRSLKEQLASLREELEGLQASERDRGKLEDIVRRMEAIVEEIPPNIQVEEPVPQGVHSILELKGLGKEVWRAIDVDKYIREERESWG